MIPALFTAAWLGLLTAISPCPLATNIAAVSFLGRHASRPRRAVAAGLAYVVGRTVTYAILAAALAAGLMASARVSRALGRFASLLVGPLLVVAGAIVLGLLPVPSFGRGGPGLADRLGKRGDVLGALLLGAVFALSFCPSSAAIFFGGLLPLSAKSGSVVGVPIAYGLATGAPVAVFAMVVAGGGAGLGRAYAHAEKPQPARR